MWKDVWRNKELILSRSGSHDYSFIIFSVRSENPDWTKLHCAVAQSPAPSEPPLCSLTTGQALALQAPPVYGKVKYSNRSHSAAFSYGQLPQHHFLFEGQKKVLRGKGPLLHHTHFYARLCWIIYICVHSNLKLHTQYEKPAIGIIPFIGTNRCGSNGKTHKNCGHKM